MTNPKSLDYIEDGQTFRAVQIFGEGDDGKPALIYASSAGMKISTWAYGSWPADSYLEQTGTGTGDNTVLFTSGDLSSYNVHMIQASAGVVDVEVSLDGTTYTPAAGIALEDMGSVAPTTRVLVTVSTGVYMLRGKYKSIRLVQNGATAATAVLASGVM
jgi:hypothetical protein